MLLGLAGGVRAGEHPQPGSETGQPRVTRIHYERGCAVIDCESPDPQGRHRLEESADLDHWRSIPIATFTRSGNHDIRTTMVGLTESTRFFRIARVEEPGPEAPVYVNLQVDAELDDVAGIRNMADELERRGITATVYTTADYANRNATYLYQLHQRGFEIGLHGYYTGEQLASMTYAEQKDLLSRARLAVQGCIPCGLGREIASFRPQHFSQNEDTCRVLDELGLKNNSGYKVGQLFVPGHQWDATPYPVSGHGFSAIPITTVPVGFDRVYLCDIACAQVLKWTPDQWREAMLLGLAEALETRQPLVLLLHGYYSGDTARYGYWQPFLDFLDAAGGKVTFVRSSELVALARSP